MDMHLGLQEYIERERRKIEIILKTAETYKITICAVIKWSKQETINPEDPGK
jgi:hypothetical protein